MNKIINEHKEFVNPYINTSLSCPIILYHNQFDNKIYLHIKTNLINKLLGKCYKDYGFISKIYKIDEYSDGVIEPEDPSCSCKFLVKFSCRLCIPPKNKEIVFKIDRMNKVLISGENGPIKTIITNEKINKDKFFIDNNRNIRIKNDSEILVPGKYIKVLILSYSFNEYSKNILVIGYLQGIADEDEIKFFNEYNNF